MTHHFTVTPAAEMATWSAVVRRARGIAARVTVITGGRARITAIILAGRVGTYATRPEPTTMVMTE